MSLQLDIIPCRIRNYLPFPKQETATALGFAIGEDGVRYIVKSNTANPLVCATEWVCTSIADFLHIPVAPCKVLQLPNGELLFGTAVYDPRLTDIEAAQILISKGPRNDVIVPELVPILSATYTLDLFVGNYDRHAGNFIFSVEALMGAQSKTARLRTVDYDSATLLSDEISILPLSEFSQTVSFGRRIRQAHGFDSRSAEDTIERIRTGRHSMFDRAMVGMPDAWLPKGKRLEFEKWAKSKELENRLEELSKGLSDGTYL